MRLLPIAIAVAVVLFKYVTAETFVNPETGERHRAAFSTTDELLLGSQAYREVLAGAQVVSSGPDFDRVRRVTARLIDAVRDDSRVYDWQVAVVQSPERNAFCLPGGRIVVYTGILPVTASDAGLAAVLGHEIAHASSRHGAQRVLQQDSLNSLLAGVQGSLQMDQMEAGQRRMILGLLGAGAQVGLALPFSRDHELEADAIGLKYMARAGYDPREAVAFWKRMQEAAGDKPPQWLSTHPADDTRIREIERLLPEALKDYHPLVEAP